MAVVRCCRLTVVVATAVPAAAAVSLLLEPPPLLPLTAVATHRCYSCRSSPLREISSGSCWKLLEAVAGNYWKLLLVAGNYWRLLL
ncbi:hypothetical protein MANES_12G097102v8 [Manihot esculenta]|uniref:Uncharacterized protein n=2 Tax=Manihot esculenta TaxID=3983 RepID=A0ACB7GS93_MANES|nr:hypothetical protein MANES_12G097102v8 [Manihot esculenta]